MVTEGTLREQLAAERKAAFFRLRGAYPIPLAGAIYWAALGAMGYAIHNRGLWIFIAFATSGTIFPLAILLSRLCRIDFMHDRTAISDLTFPALTSMVLFWPMAFAAYSNYPALVPLILAVGLSVAWPVMGWIYGQTALFTTHAITRAIVCFVLWTWFPSTRFTLLPLSVSAIYLITIGAILVATSPKSRARQSLPA